MRLVAVAALLSAGCGPVTATRTGQTASAPQTTAPAACVSSDLRLALVTLRGSNLIVVSDVTDIAHPQTVGTLGPLPAPVGASSAMNGAIGQFVCGKDVSFVGGSTDDHYALPTTLFRAPLAGSPRTAVVSGNQAVLVFASSPDGTTVTYLASGADTAIHQVKGGQDVVLATVPQPGLAGGCEVAPCPGPLQNLADNWDFRLMFSPDGTMISMAQSSITNYIRIWTSDGKAVWNSESSGSTMSVWSGRDLYFRGSKGVEVWRAGAVSTFLPGVAWIRPEASPSGGQIVYEARDAQGSAHVFIVDTASGQVRDLGKGRAEPAFLTSRYLWYQSEPAGKTYMYDLHAGTESESAITSVIDTWPHAA